MKRTVPPPFVAGAVTQLFGDHPGDYVRKVDDASPARDFTGFVRWHILVVPVLPCFLIGKGDVKALLICSSRPSCFSVFFSDGNISVLVGAMLVGVNRVVGGEWWWKLVRSIGGDMVPLTCGPVRVEVSPE